MRRDPVDAQEPAQFDGKAELFAQFASGRILG